MKTQPKQKVPKEQEHQIQRRIVDLLEAAGAEVVENRSQKWDALASAVGARSKRARQRAKGQVDIIAAIPGGVTLWIEVKRIGGRITPEQIEHQQRLGHLGHESLITDTDEGITWWAKRALSNEFRDRWNKETLAFARKLVGA